VKWLTPKGRWGLAGRAFLAALIVVACTAGATTVAGLLQVKNLVVDLNASKPIKHSGVTLPNPGAPQTLLLIGADRRIGESTKTVGNTDTMLLVRINPNSSTINLLSIPRDLRVTAPGGGYEKLNAVYSAGGPKGLIDTLNQQVFPGIKHQVNHVMVVSFLGFAHLIDDIGCVYGAVDQRYYNHNDPIYDTDPSYPNNFSNINLQPGYQKMCGGDGGPSSALAFVRYRHTDTDQVRNARQQDFLRWTKGQFSVDYLENNYARLARDFGKNVQTDSFLHSTKALLELFSLVIDADGHQVKTIQYQESYSPPGGPAYVLPTSPGEYANAYRRFLTPTVPKPVVHKPKHHKKKKAKGPFKPPSGMIADPNDAIDQAKALGNTGIPIYYPQYIPSTYNYCLYADSNCSEGFEPATSYEHSYPRNYMVTGPHNRKYHAWVMTLLWEANNPSANGLASGLYFNVQGLAWKNPPLLNKPTETKMVNHKRLLIYSQGGLISTVAWEKSHAVYWIQNTLENTIPNNQMIAMAATLTPYHG
jgi:polyisoprenyl-teichoic acid--peptidoglycan teichoic acid transferase